MTFTIVVSGHIDVNHHVILPQPTSDEITAVVTPLLTAMKDQIMSALDDAIATLGTSTDAAVTRVTADVADLKAQLAALQASGGASPATLAAIAAIQGKIDALDPTSTTVLPPATP